MSFPLFFVLFYLCSLLTRLLELCTVHRYALEARRLGDAEAEELAGVFDAVKAAAR